MALVVTGRGSTSSATNRTSGQTWATAAFTPSANSLLLAFHGTQGGPDVASNGIASMSGHGTWNELTVGSGPDIGGNDQLLEVWYTITSSSPSSTAVTMTNSTQTKIRYATSIVEVSGIDSAAAIGSIVLQFVDENNGTANLSGDANFGSAFSKSTNATVAAVYCARYQEDTAWDSPMVEIHDLATGTEVSRLSTAGYVGEDATPGFSWGANNRTWRTVALEINDPTVAGATPERMKMGVGV